MFENFFSITVTLFLVIDALGNVPVYLSLMKKYDKKKRLRVALRELIFALIIMVLFNYLGEVLLSLLGITKSTVQIGGGIILFLIAIRLIFSVDEEKPKWGEQAPFIVPIATPIIAGPSLLALIMIFAEENPNTYVILLAIFVAWFFSSIIFLFAAPIYKVIKEKGLMACQRLMGLIVALIAVQMFLAGMEGVLSKT